MTINFERRSEVYLITPRFTWQKSLKKSFNFYILLYDLFIGFIAICPSNNDPQNSCKYSSYCGYEKSCNRKAVVNCFSTQTSLCSWDYTILSILMQEKSFKTVIISAFLFKIWSTLFSPVGDWFPWKWKWNKHSSF